MDKTTTLSLQLEMLAHFPRFQDSLHLRSEIVLTSHNDTYVQSVQVHAETLLRSCPAVFRQCR